MLLGMQNSALMSYVPAVVAYPDSAVSEKFLPCCVWFWMKVVASRLVWGTAISKIPVRAETVTGTVMLMHVLAAAVPVSTATARADLADMSAVFRASRVVEESDLPGPVFANHCSLSF